MSRELDEACARALGINVVVDYEIARNEQVAVGWYDGEKGDENAQPILEYSTDHAAARQLEDAIERRGLQRRYVFALMKETGVIERDYNDELVMVMLEWIWLTLRATLEQRARAFLEAVGEKAC